MDLRRNEGDMRRPVRRRRRREIVINMVFRHEILKKLIN